MESDFSQPEFCLELPVNVTCESELEFLKEPTEEKNHVCKICSKTFLDKNKFKKHVSTHAAKKYFTCDVCKKQFTQKVTLKTHELIHKGEKPHACDVCGKKFTDKSTLRKHHLIHFDKKPHTCAICQRSFVQKITLQKHYLTHTGEKPYECNVCSKKFSQKYTLRQHYRIHSKYPCKFCNMTFPGKKMLRRHERAHTTGKISSVVCNANLKKENHLKKHEVETHFYFCDICHIGFKGENKFEQHYATHKSGGIYKCGVCLQTFSNAKTFKSHQALSHPSNNQAYRCNICKLKFKNALDLKKHFHGHNSDFDCFCNKCGILFVKKTEYEVHLKNHGIEQPLANNISKDDLMSVELKESKLEHTSDDGAVTDFFNDVISDLVDNAKTNENFSDESNISECNHSNLDSGYCVILCEKCGEIVDNEVDFSVHLLWHTSSESNLSEHSRSPSLSSEDYEILCEKCGEFFYSEFDFSNHLFETLLHTCCVKTVVS